MINGTPADLSEGDAVGLLEKMLENYKINRSDLQLERKLGIAKTMASQLSVKANTSLSEKEMESIVDQLFGCSVAEVAPDGKKTYVLLTLDELSQKL